MHTITPYPMRKRPQFSASEVGLFKSVVLVNRLNLFWDWTGRLWPAI